MTKQQLEKKLAREESLYDQLISELTHLDVLMKNVGFPGGISGLKTTAQEFCNRREEEEDKNF